MINSVISVSDDLDPIEGVRKVVADCRKKMGGRKAHAGIFFTSCLDADYSLMLTEIHAAFPDIELIGCTTDGEITHARGHTEDSSALLLFSADHLGFAAAVAEHISQDSTVSLQGAVDQAKSYLSGEPAAAFVFPDGLTTMNVPIDEVMRSVLGNLPIFGGSAGDGFQIKQTYQFHGTRVFSDAMPVMLVAGDLDLAVDIATGPVPYGDYYPVDKVENNVLYNIDGVTALEFYERFFGEYIEDRELSFFPLAIYTDGRDDFVLRDPLTVNRSDGSISFVGRIEGPCRVRIAQVTREDTLNSGHQGAERILSAFEGSEPDLILLFSCASRKHVLGSRTDEEFKVLTEHTGKVPFFGFYSYGEIGPFVVGEQVRFHSDTCVSVALKSRV